MSIEKDMLRLAKLAYKVSVKHGHINIYVAKCTDSILSWTTYGEDLKDQTYRADNKEEN